MVIEKCPACKQDVVAKTAFCSSCNFPFNGSEKEKALHIGRFISNKGVLTDSDTYIEKSQKLLYFVAALNVLFLIIGISQGTYQLVDIIFNGVITVAIFLCGFLIRKNPLLFVLFPLAIIIGVNILNYIVDPRSVFQGILLKLVILGSLGYSAYLIMSAKQFKKKFKIKD